MSDLSGLLRSIVKNRTVTKSITLGVANNIMSLVSITCFSAHCPYTQPFVHINVNIEGVQGQRVTILRPCNSLV